MNTDKQDFRSQELIRLCGYGLLLFALLDFLHLTIPLRLMNPVWEFQLLGALVERLPIPLLGMVMAFYGERPGRGEFELVVVRILSWFALVLAVGFVLMIPLGIVNGVRLDALAVQQTQQQTAQQLQPFADFKFKLAKATSDAEIRRLVRDSGATNVLDQPVAEKLKEQAQQSIAKTEAGIRSRMGAVQHEQRLSLLKNSVKWNLGAFLASILFLHIWFRTGWARSRRRPRTSHLPEAAVGPAVQKPPA